MLGFKSSNFSANTSLNLDDLLANQRLTGFVFLEISHKTSAYNLSFFFPVCSSTNFINDITSSYAKRCSLPSSDFVVICGSIGHKQEYFHIIISSHPNENKVAALKASNGIITLILLNLSLAYDIILRTVRGSHHLDCIRKSTSFISCGIFSNCSKKQVITSAHIIQESFGLSDVV
jgi:hypothetical protein